MKYYLVAGERSGDLHGSNLMKAILADDPEADFRFWGGDEMQKVGGKMVKHYRETAFMGFLEVAMNLRKIFALIRECQLDIKNWQADVVILIDYAGFNLRIAKFIKKEKLTAKTFFYISPKVWAWNTKRAWKIKANIDKMFVIFPFEVSFYQKFDYQVNYVGNPLLDAIAPFQVNPNFKNENQLGDKPIIALLPGSRKQEVKNMLSQMLAIVPQFPDYQFVVAGVSNLSSDFYTEIKNYPQVKFVLDSTYDLLTIAESAIVTSGTATLETALFQVPQVVVYKTSWISYQISKAVIKIPFISLVNLIGEKEIVKELIQKDLNAENLVKELKKVNVQGEKRSGILKDYQNLKTKIGEAGASTRAGQLMVKYLREMLK